VVDGVRRVGSRRWDDGWEELALYTTDSVSARDQLDHLCLCEPLARKVSNMGGEGILRLGHAGVVRCFRVDASTSVRDLRASAI
jgi:hypothetical protein